MVKSGVKYFKHLDLLRIIACICILLFHLGLMKGGYLAVCLFFTLSGYLGCIKNYR
jgi:peptidoglycan/LPS O-acetylase OafA/YrhL